MSKSGSYSCENILKSAVKSNKIQAEGPDHCASAGTLAEKDEHPLPFFSTPRTDLTSSSRPNHTDRR